MGEMHSFQSYKGCSVSLGEGSDVGWQWEPASLQQHLLQGPTEESQKQ